MELSKTIKPVCLPKDRSEPAGLTGTVVGWGRTSEGGTLPGIVQHVDVPILTLDQCRSMKYRASRITSNMVSNEGISRTISSDKNCHNFQVTKTFTSSYVPARESKIPAKVILVDRCWCDMAKNTKSLALFRGVLDVDERAIQEFTPGLHGICPGSGPTWMILVCVRNKTGSNGFLRLLLLILLEIIDC